jgi:hypothetical protein
VPAIDVWRRMCERVGHQDLAARDLTEQMAKPNGVRSMRRRIGPIPPGADPKKYPERERLPRTHWMHCRLSVTSGTLICEVRTREHRGAAMLVTQRGYVYYIWQPDWQKANGQDLASTAQPPEQPSVEKKQTKLGRPLKHDYVRITLEIAWRVATATKKQRDVSDLQEARNVLAWCEEHLGKKPPLTDIRSIVLAARDRFRQPE